jgi:hypothetical protein
MKPLQANFCSGPAIPFWIKRSAASGCCFEVEFQLSLSHASNDRQTFTHET